MATPRLCVSHSVTGGAIMRLEYGAGPTAINITIPTGVYWTDPLYHHLAIGASSPDLATEVAYISNLAHSNLFNQTVEYTAQSPSGVWTLTVGTDHDIQFRMGNANCTAAGRLIARRLGIDPGVAYGSAPTTSLETMLVQGAWEPDRGEASILAETMSGDTGSVVVADDGTSYTLYTDNPQRMRMVSLLALPGAYTVRQARFADATVQSSFDRSFESNIYQWLRRGEMVRYYSDNAATYTYLTSAITATAGSITVANNTGFAANQVVIVDGESVELVANISGTTWSVRRIDPVPHASWSPVATGGAWVGTYVLADDGGNVSRGQFAPQRRAINQDRWDMEISLVRATP